MLGDAFFGLNFSRKIFLVPTGYEYGTEPRFPPHTPSQRGRGDTGTPAGGYTRGTPKEAIPYKFNTKFLIRHSVIFKINQFPFSLLANK